MSKFLNFGVVLLNAQDYLATAGRFGQFFRLVTDSTFQRACRTTNYFVDRTISKYLSTINSRTKRSGDGINSFLGALVPKAQDPRELRDHCLNILLDRRDTAGGWLTWTLSVIYCLSVEVLFLC